MKTRIVLILCLIILATSTTAFAVENTKVIPGLGTLILPTNIKEIPYQLLPTKHAFSGFTLLANDNNILRSNNIVFLPGPTIDRKGLKADISYLTTTFNKLNASLIDSGAPILNSYPINIAAIDNEQLAVYSVRTLRFGMVVRMSFYILDGSDGLIAMLTIHADGDINYWLPKTEKMIADIKR